MLNTNQQRRHAMLSSATPDELARQEFAKSLKQFIQSDLLPPLGTVFAKRVAGRYREQHDHIPANRHEIREAMVADEYFRTYAAVNRIGQELIWDSVIDSIERDLDDLADTSARCSASNGGALAIPARFDVPRYVTAVDIHCMPGGYASTSEPSRLAAGALYDRGVYLYSMGYMGPDNDDMGRSVCNYISRKLRGFVPKRILDMGCTVGHSTLPYKEAFPDAEVWGIDVAEPQVRFAHARAGALGRDVNFAQMNAERTDFEDGFFDLIVSHILLHETSLRAMPRIFAECHRLLSHGGYMIHADLPPFDLMDPFTQFILDNETYYNNEPFWGKMRDMDQIALAAAVGFPPDDIRFDTAPMAILGGAEAAGSGRDPGSTEDEAERAFAAGEFAPGGGWEVLIARKA